MFEAFAMVAVPVVIWYLIVRGTKKGISRDNLGKLKQARELMPEGTARDLVDEVISDLKG